MNIVNSMKKIIITLICLLLIPTIFAKIDLQTVYSLQVEIFKDDIVTLMDLTAGSGTISTFPTTKKDYSIKVLDPGNKVLFDKDIEVSFILLLEPMKTVPLNSTIIHVRVPYFSNAKKVSIYHFNKEIFSVDISEEICNNNFICELGENKYNCPNDCDVKKEFSWFLFILIVFLLTIAVIFFLRKFNK